jgi:hypothetical protein
MTTIGPPCLVRSVLDLIVPQRHRGDRSTGPLHDPIGVSTLIDSQLLLLIVPILLVQLGLIILAVRDLIRPERRVRGDSKLLWGVIIVIVNLIGPLLYFAVGRRET